MLQAACRMSSAFDFDEWYGGSCPWRAEHGAERIERTAPAIDLVGRYLWLSHVRSRHSEQDGSQGVRVLNVRMTPGRAIRQKDSTCASGNVTARRSRSVRRGSRGMKAHELDGGGPRTFATPAGHRGTLGQTRGVSGEVGGAAVGPCSAGGRFATPAPSAGLAGRGRRRARRSSAGARHQEGDVRPHLPRELRHGAAADAHQHEHGRAERRSDQPDGEVDRHDHAEVDWINPCPDRDG